MESNRILGLISALVFSLFVVFVGGPMIGGPAEIFAPANFIDLVVLLVVISPWIWLFVEVNNRIVR